MKLHKEIAQICLKETPLEACGVVKDGRAIKCTNHSDSPESSFMISAEDYLQYRPNTIFHSHPKGLAGFSEHDLAVAANMELTSYVYVVDDDRLEKWSEEEGVVVFENVLKAP